MVEQKKQFNESLGKKVDFNIGEIVLVLKRHVKKGQVKKLTHMWRYQRTLCCYKKIQ